MARLGVPAGVVRHTIHYDVIDPDYPVGARSTTQPHPAQHAPFQCQAENADATLEPILRAGEAGRSMAGESAMTVSKSLITRITAKMEALSMLATPSVADVMYRFFCDDVLVLRKAYK